MVTIALLGTLDTKLNELLKLRELVLRAGAREVILIDAGRKDTHDPAITISHPALIRYGDEAGKPKGTPNFDSASRGEIIEYLTRSAEKCAQKLYKDGRIQGIASAGGSCGTSLATAAMRSLPIGFPKVMVSTVGSGDVSPFVGETDIFMVYSIVDVAGWNGMLETVFRNAAGAVVGASEAASEAASKRSEDLSHENRPGDRAKARRRIGITMFGVTTPCVDMIRNMLELDGVTEVYVFHATGHGGKAMERLVETGELDAVIDLTTTEICDFFMGGNMAADEHRLEASLRAGIPYVISVGACDMVNFGARSTVPEKYRSRKLYEHNPAVTLMRTTPEECQKIGSFISEKIIAFSKDPKKIRLILPGDGVSLISSQGQAYHDPEADGALLEAVTLKEGSSEYPEIVRRPEAINDEAFAKAAVEALNSIPT